MNIQWLSNHWTILGFVFVAGSAWAGLQGQVKDIEDVVVVQASFYKKHEETDKSILLLSEQIKRIEDQLGMTNENQKKMDDKLDYLIKLQIERQNRE